jgi:hypothetical protein
LHLNIDHCLVLCTPFGALYICIFFTKIKADSDTATDIIKHKSTLYMHWNERVISSASVILFQI